MQRAEQELHLAAVATPLLGDSGKHEGVVLVLDDVTPLIRTQKVAAWREVARRLAHEIKNPLTPIQLSAERLRRHFTDAPAGARALVDECTTTIVGEVESLKGLVDEFSQFARMPAPRAAIDRSASVDRRDPRALRRSLRRGDDRAALRARRQGGSSRSRADPPCHHQPGRQRGRSDGAARLHRRRDPARRCQQRRPHCRRRQRPRDSAGRAREAVPAVLLDEGRGSGLGLAIVRRIIAEHGGSIEVGTTQPSGTRFTIELPW